MMEPTPEAMEVANKFYGGKYGALAVAMAVELDAFASRRVAEREAKDSSAMISSAASRMSFKSGEQPYAVGYKAGVAEKDAEIAALREALQEIAENGHNISFPFVGRAKRALSWAAPPSHTIPSKGDAE